MKVAFSKWTRQNFEKLKYMDPRVQKIFVEFFCRISEEGIYFRVPSEGGRRTHSDQLELYSRKPKVTWVLCPDSWHCHGLAVDIIPMTRIGVLEYKAVWSGQKYERIARIAMELGITWGFAEWGVDKPHFHLSAGQHIGSVSNIQDPEFTISEKDEVTKRALMRLGYDPETLLPFPPSSHV